MRGPPAASSDANTGRSRLARNVSSTTTDPQVFGSREWFVAAPTAAHGAITGLKLDEMLRAISVLASGPGLVGNHARELNPHNAAADSGLLERFAGTFADALSCGITAPDVRDHDHEERGDA